MWGQATDGDANAHFLEGSVQNIARQIFALPSGLEALNEGQFFVANSDNEVVLDGLCKTLRLRGIKCA